jgi:hypothetical protein
MSDMEKLIVRCWSACVARGEPGDHVHVAAELRKHIAEGMMPDVETRLQMLRRQGAIPAGQTVAS